MKKFVIGLVIIIALGAVYLVVANTGTVHTSHHEVCVSSTFSSDEHYPTVKELIEKNELPEDQVQDLINRGGI